MAGGSRGGWREAAIVLLGFAILTIIFTFPLAFRLGSVGRVDNGDGQFSIWNVAWVARALVRDPRHVLDANIFYPHRGTLAYSEMNLGAGAVAVPVYWATHNPYAAHNFVLLLSFVLSGTGMYYLARYLTHNRHAAVVSGICYAFCPYVFGHTPHIQLLMTAGLPFGLLAFHRLADRPTVGRGVVLGLVMAAQALFCGYYAIFLTLTIGFAVLVTAAFRALWLNRPFWIAVGIAALIAIACAAPITVPYVRLQRNTGFLRPLAIAQQFAAGWRSYLSSSSYVHRWVIRGGVIGELLFPGFVAVLFGTWGALRGWRAGGRAREVVVLYGSLGVLAAWLSLGPSAGLYSLFFKIVPLFNFLRAPSRFGVIIVLVLAVFSAFAVAALMNSSRRPALSGIAIACFAVAELLVPIRFPPVLAVEEPYGVLRTLPPGPVLELPVYSRRFAYARERYMLNSTVHWMPLIDGYSDYTPPDFADHADTLAAFPTRESFHLLESIGARYAIFHPHAYDAGARKELILRLQHFAPYLRQWSSNDGVWLYEIIGWPP